MVWVNVCCESVSTIPFQWFIEVLSLDGILKATSLGTYFTSSAVVLSTSAISGPCCTTHLCPPSVQSLLRPCSHPSLFIAFQCPLIVVDLWHSHPKQSASSSFLLTRVPQNFHWSFPAVSDLTETVGISPLPQKVYHPGGKDTPCRLHAVKFWCGCDQIKFIAISK